MKNTASATAVRMHGSYGRASHDKQRPAPKRRARWDDRMTAEFDPKLVAFKCS